MNNKDIQKAIKRNEKIIKNAKAEIRGGKVALIGLYLIPVLGWLLVPSKKRHIAAQQQLIMQAEAALIQLEKIAQEAN